MRSRARLRTPKDLLARIRSSDASLRAWRSLTPAARRMGATWIDGARSQRVRDWRIRDVLRRARRYASGAGPFYPRNDEQHRLSRRGAMRARASR